MVRHSKEQNIERAAIEITALLKETVDKSVPIHNLSPRSKPWWNEEIRTQRKHVHSILKNWKVGRNECT